MIEIPKPCIFRNLGWVEIDHETKKVHRIIKSKAVADFLRSDLFKNKVGEYWVNAIEVHDYKPLDVETLDEYYVFKVDYIDHVNFMTEWTSKNFIDGLILLCDINLYCIENGYGCNTHLWNIILQNGKPILLDIGDFLEKPLVATAFDCITKSTTPTKSHHVIKSLNQYISNSEDINNEIISVVNSGLSDRDKFIKIKTILKNCLHVISNNPTWSKYETEIPTTPEEIRDKHDKKSLAIYNFLKRVKPKTITDLGCNTGIYSSLGNHFGAKCIGIDIHDDILDEANNIAIERKLKASFLKIDLLNPPIAGGINGVYGTSSERLKSECVLAPALYHHMFRASEDMHKVIDTICSYSEKYAMIEFIPSTDKYVSTWSQVSKWNTKEEVIERIKHNGFTNVSVEESYPAPRIWIIAQRN